jgi:hypothetical protein
MSPEQKRRRAARCSPPDRERPRHLDQSLSVPASAG